MIPKKIHYCWFGNKPLSHDVKKCIKSWRKYCPDYEIIQWNEKNFNIDEHPFTQKAYKEKAWAFVSDYARLKVIYDEGGIYLDTDVELLKNLDFLLKNKFYIGLQQSQLLCTTGLGYGAEAKNEIVEKMLRKYNEIDYNESNKVAFACPYLNNEVMIEEGYDYSDEIVDINGIVIFPPRYFDPLAPGNTRTLLCDDTVSIHHYSASWTPLKNRLKRKIICFIGEENVNEIKKKLKREEKNE